MLEEKNYIFKVLLSILQSISFESWHPLEHCSHGQDEILQTKQYEQDNRLGCDERNQNGTQIELDFSLP